MDLKRCMRHWGFDGRKCSFAWRRLVEGKKSYIGMIKKGLKLRKLKCRELCSVTLAHKRHRKWWSHLNVFNVEVNSEHYFATCPLQFGIKFSNILFDVFMFYHIVVTDMLDFKIQNGDSFNNCIRISKLMHFKSMRL